MNYLEYVVKKKNDFAQVPGNSNEDSQTMKSSFNISILLYVSIYRV